MSTTSQYVCLPCSKRFRRRVLCIHSVCRRCTGVCAVETTDEQTGQMKVTTPRTAPILAKASALQINRR